jgi:azobenzene reductase
LFINHLENFKNTNPPLPRKSLTLPHTPSNPKGMTAKTDLNFELAILCGSVRQGRKSIYVANWFAQSMAKVPGITVNFLDLADYDLPIMSERRGKHPNLPEAAEKLGAHLERADALLIVSPEYNGSYPGVLKNALDYYYDEFAKKPVGLVTVSGGRQGGISALLALQVLFVKVGSFVSPAKMQVAEVEKVFDEHGTTDNEHFLKSAQRFVTDYLWFAEAILAKKQKG